MIDCEAHRGGSKGAPKAWQTYESRFSHQTEYQARGLTVIPNVIPPGQEVRWLARALELVDAHGVYREQELDGKNEQYGRIQGKTVEGEAIEQEWPELVGLYYGMAAAVRSVVGLPITLSPYPRSRIVVRQYFGKGSEAGWHLDTNGVTGLLYLTTHPASSGQGSTSYVPPEHGLDVTKEEHVWPTAGDFLIMDARRVYHRVRPMLDDETMRITVPFNYYVDGEVWRPAGLDDIT